MKSVTSYHTCATASKTGWVTLNNASDYWAISDF